MTEHFYDATTDTVRRYGHLTAGPDIGERFDKKLRDWSGDCCRIEGCKWDSKISETAALAIVEGQKKNLPLVAGGA
jgi:hypothetical protein